MNGFIQRHAASVMGILNGFDRLRLRGTKRLLANRGGMMSFLWQERVLLKHFKDYALAATDRIRQATEGIAKAAGQTIRYLASSSRSKEEFVREIAETKSVQEGLICILRCVEPCWSYEIHRNREKKEIELQGGRRKCLHYYHYYRHPEMGLLHVRLQTWFPFSVHVCVNGREWLARQMDTAGIGYRQRDNGFVEIADLVGAQALMDRQRQTDWPTLLDGLVAGVNQAETELFRMTPVPYYWSVDQSEWASDVMFTSPEALAALYPRLIRHGMQNLGSLDEMRFLGRKVPAHNGRYGTFKGEVVTDLKERPEGIRIKHRVDRNSIKMYDKQGSVLRVETTLNDARVLKVYRPKEGDPQGPKEWRYLRKGVADLHRRAHVSQAANDRYLASLASVEETRALLRAHGLIRKVQKTHRYVLTKEGTQAITALLAARAADTAKLITAA